MDGNPFLPSWSPAPRPSDDPDPTDPEGLSQVERGMVRGLLSGSDVEESSASVGIQTDEGRRVLDRPPVRSALDAALRRRGLDEDRVARTLDEGLNATRSVYHQGIRIDEVPDHSARKGYLDTLLDIRGDRKQRDSGEGQGWEVLLFALRSQRSGSGGEDR